MTNYAKIDHANRRIVMDRTFAKNAEIVGSVEYKIQYAPGHRRRLHHGCSGELYDL